MLTHNYQHWWSRFAHLTPGESTLVLVGVLALAGLSVLKPEFFKHQVIRLGRWIIGRFRWRRSGSDGIVVADTFLSDTARLGQTWFGATTGGGKTVGMKYVLFQDLARGHGAFIVDPKGDRELYMEVRDYCREIGRENDLHLLSATYPDESVRWNPCRLGNASELQSKWFTSGVYSEPFYAKACELGLLQAFNSLLVEQPRGFTLGELVKQLRRQAEDSRSSHMQGLFLELENFAQGEWGPLLCAPKPDGGRSVGTREISLLEITRKNEILFVDLPTEAKKVQSARVGKLLLQELMLISGLRKIYPAIRGKQPFSVFVDEFDAFATEEFVTFLNKGRSSKFMIHIAHQTLGDLEKVSRTYKDQILGNCNVFFTFRLNVPRDAEEMAKFIGTKTVVKKTFQTENGLRTGRSSNRETQEFKVHPDTIKELKVGECVLAIKNEGLVKRIKIPWGWRPPKRSRHMPSEREPWRGVPERKGEGDRFSPLLERPGEPEPDAT